MISKITRKENKKTIFFDISMCKHRILHSYSTRKKMSERIIFYGLNKIKPENNRLFIELLLFLQPFCGLMQNDE